MNLILGIDPGLSGALAFYCPEEDTLEVLDMPTHEVKRNGSTKRTLDLYQLGQIIDARAAQMRFAMIEEVSAMPKQGVSSSFSFGFSAGAAQMAVAANMVPMKTISPSAWKKRMGLNASKDGSRLMASKLLSKHVANWPLKKHDGRAEAALLAYYGAHHAGP